MTLANNKVTFLVELTTADGTPINSAYALKCVVAPVLADSIGAEDFYATDATVCRKGKLAPAMSIAAMVDTGKTNQADILHACHTIAAALHLPSVYWTREAEIGAIEYA
jgi:hypothetical protein